MRRTERDEERAVHGSRLMLLSPIPFGFWFGSSLLPLFTSLLITFSIPSLHLHSVRLRRVTRGGDGKV